MLNCLSSIKIFCISQCCIIYNLLSNTAPPRSRWERMLIFAFLAFFCLDGYKSNLCLLHVIKCVIYFIMYECRLLCFPPYLFIWLPPHLIITLSRRRGCDSPVLVMQTWKWIINQMCWLVHEVPLVLGYFWGDWALWNLWSRGNDLILIMQRKGKNNFDGTVREV